MHKRFACRLVRQPVAQSRGGSCRWRAVSFGVSSASWYLSIGTPLSFLHRSHLGTCGRQNADDEAGRSPVRPAPVAHRARLPHDSPGAHRNRYLLLACSFGGPHHCHRQAKHSGTLDHIAGATMAVGGLSVPHRHHQLHGGQHVFAGGEVGIAVGRSRTAKCAPSLPGRSTHRKQRRCLVSPCGCGSPPRVSQPPGLRPAPAQPERRAGRHLGPDN